MSIKLMTAVWDNQSGNLDVYETAYLSKLADISSDNGTGIWPSIKTLSEKTRISERKIKYMNQTLPDKGYLEVVERTRENGSQTSNEYRLNANKLYAEAGMPLLCSDETPPVYQTPPHAHRAPPHAHDAPPPCTPCTPYKQELKQVLKQDLKKHTKKKTKTESLPSVAGVGKGELDNGFILFWEAYPVKKGGKEVARKSFNKALKATSLAHILRSIEEQAQERAQKARVGAFVPEWPYPSTWLNQARWDDCTQSQEQIEKMAPKGKTKDQQRDGALKTMQSIMEMVNNRVIPQQVA